MWRRLNPGVLTLCIGFVWIGGWIVAGAGGALKTAAGIVAFALADLILMFDMIDLLARVWLRRAHGGHGVGPSVDLCLSELSRAEETALLRPFAILAAVHDAADHIDEFIDAMQPFKESVWLIDDASSDNTLVRLKLLGWKCTVGRLNRKKPGAIFDLLKSLPHDIESVLVLDPDVRIVGNAAEQRDALQRVMLDFQRSGAAAVSPRVMVRPGGWLTACQALEYELSGGLGRKSLADFSTNSGVSIYRRSALEGALAQHTLSVYAEDLENSILLLGAGERIYYDDRLIFVTTAKRTWRGWLSQRVGWSFGWGKVFIERFPIMLKIARRGPLAAYQYIFYFGIAGVLLLPVKLISVGLLIGSFAQGCDEFFGFDVIPDYRIIAPVYFAVCFCRTTMLLCIAICVAISPGQRARHFPTAPFYVLYALIHFLPVTVGFFNVLTVRLFKRRIYRDHYDRDPHVATARELTLHTAIREA